MKTLAFLLCWMVGVAFAREVLRCNYSECKASNPFEELGKVRFMPTAQQLREYCPKALTFLDCNTDVLEKCTGKTLNELATADKESVPYEATMLIGIGALVRDICNPHSTLHKSYVANIECFRGFVIAGTRLCDLEAEETLGDFLTKSNIEKGGLDDVLNTEIKCLEVGYTVTCFSIRLGESCGDDAQNAFVNVVKRLKPLMLNECSGGPNNLKSKFSEYMQVDDEQRNKINEILDLFKRRR